MGMVASQTTSVSIVYLSVCSGVDQRKHQSYASLAFVWGIHRWPVNSPHKRSVTRKMVPLDDVIMKYKILPRMLVNTSIPTLHLSHNSCRRKDNPLGKWYWILARSGNIMARFIISKERLMTSEIKGECIAQALLFCRPVGTAVT